MYAIMDEARRAGGHGERGERRDPFMIWPVFSPNKINNRSKRAEAEGKGRGGSYFFLGEPVSESDNVGFCLFGFGFGMRRG